jgi:DNA-directed RNA polymerase specialized sigma24 family protein
MTEGSFLPASEFEEVETDDEPQLEDPLPRRRYHPTTAVLRQIEEASTLDITALVARAQLRNKHGPEYMSEEAIVYFIRKALTKGDRSALNGLCRELLERCTPYFRGKFFDFSPEEQEDAQGDVMKRVLEDLFAQGRNAEFMQARFWFYLRRRTVEVFRLACRGRRGCESLDVSCSEDSDGPSRLDMLTDSRLTPEQWATISDGLAILPSPLREVFFLRHYVRMKIDSDDPNELTLAKHFGRTGRTIQNWMDQANVRLAGFKEKQNDDS